MNIFVLDNDPVLSAQMMCNKHVPKMIIESAQLLCTVLDEQGNKGLAYKPTHKNHPCTRWLATSSANMAWLYDHAVALCCEHTKRFGGIHKTRAVIESTVKMIPLIDNRDHTPFVLAMPDTYKSNDAIVSYRTYYIGEKSRFAKWEPRTTQPSWWPSEL